MRLTVIVSLLCVGACAASPPEHYPPSMSIGSGYSTAISEPAHFAATGVGMSRELEAGLVVRPDALTMEARVQKKTPTAGQALALAQVATTELAARLQQATSGAATFTPCGTRVTPVGERGPTEAFDVQVEGRVEVALPPELDYWKRSALVAALAELADRYRAAEKTAPGTNVSLHSTRVVVKNPEAYRGKLTEIWVQRARAFAAAAQTHEVPLVLLDCAPPGDIAQKERSLEEVALSLSVSCRLGSPKAAPAVAR